MRAATRSACKDPSPSPLRETVAFLPQRRSTPPSSPRRRGPPTPLLRDYGDTRPPSPPMILGRSLPSTRRQHRRWKMARRQHRPCSSVDPRHQRAGFGRISGLVARVPPVERGCQARHRRRPFHHHGLHGAVEAIDPANKAATELVGDVAAPSSRLARRLLHGSWCPPRCQGICLDQSRGR